MLFSQVNPHSSFFMLSQSFIQTQASIPAIPGNRCCFPKRICWYSCSTILLLSQSSSQIKANIELLVSVCYCLSNCDLYDSFCSHEPKKKKVPRQLDLAEPEGYQVNLADNRTEQRWMLAGWQRKSAVGIWQRILLMMVRMNKFRWNKQKRNINRGGKKLATWEAWDKHVKYNVSHRTRCRSTQ